MREILFKAKCIDSGKWVEGYLFDNGFDGEEKKYFVGDLIIEKYNGTACDEWDIAGIDFCEIDPESLFQYTGLTDKNGNKIWENDIIQYGTVAAVVKFGEYGNGNLGFYVDFSEETNYRKDFSYWAKKVVVIGNAFDNQELLQEESDE